LTLSHFVTSTGHRKAPRYIAVPRRRFPLKIAAHPLVVAVALGFLDPQVLATDLRADTGAGESKPTPDELEPELVEPSEFARIEAEWQQVRDLV